MECEPQNGAESESPNKDWTEPWCAMKTRIRKFSK